MNRNAVEKPYFRELLCRTLETRADRNPRYSLRSFARDLALSPQRLSDLIRGRYGLSSTQASKIARSLGLAGDELKRFVASADMFHARSARKKEKAAAEFKSLNSEFSSITLDSFQVISDWYHYAILELTYTNDFRSEPSWIAQKLELPVFTVEQAIERLKRLDLLEFSSDGTFKCSNTFLATPSGIPNDALRKFHRQLLEKAMQALELQTVEERDITSMVVAVDSSRMSEAKEDLKNFRREFAKKYGSAPNQNEVYCLGMQFFRLQKKS